MISYWCPGPLKDPKDWPGTIQAIEVTPDKKVVWALSAWTPPADLGPATCIQLLDEPGIPEDRREDVFKPFVRLDEARTQDSGGTGGLGLAIARDIARSHGGDIELENAPKGGLRAIIRIPA